MTAKHTPLVHVDRILVAVDGSAPSEGALDSAITLASAFRAKVVLISVAPLVPEYARHEDLLAAFLERLAADSRAYLDAAAAKVRTHGLDVETVARTGYPAEEICALADEAKADLVVLGQRGRRGKGIHLIGSVSYNVANFASASVLVVRDGRPPRRILLPVDGSPASVRAADWAGEIAFAHRAGLRLLYVIPRGTEEVKFTVTRGVGEPFLGPLAQSLEERGVIVDRAVEYGRVAETIVDDARKHDADLIVLGPRGKGGPEAWALGGVTDRVLRFALCSTLVAR